MAYASTGLIQATDYNNLAFNGTNIGDQWGVGTINHGLGQSTSPIATVATSNTVTATQWTGLIQTINNCLSHEGQTPISPTSVTTGQVVTAYSSITTGSALAYTQSGTTGLALSASSPTTTTYNSAWGNSGSFSLVFTQTVTFGTGDAARYFFNAGGTIALTFSRSGGSATSVNTHFSTLASSSGTVTFGYNNTTQSGNSFTAATLLNANNGGYWAGTGSPVVHFLQNDTSGYNSDTIQVSYYWSGTSANGGFPVLNLTTTWTNGQTSTAVDGATSTSIVVNSPATTYLANTWGTPAVGGSVSPV